MDVEKRSGFDYGVRKSEAEMVLKIWSLAKREGEDADKFPLRRREETDPVYQNWCSLCIALVSNSEFDLVVNGWAEVPDEIGETTVEGTDVSEFCNRENLGRLAGVLVEETRQMMREEEKEKKSSKKRGKEGAQSYRRKKARVGGRGGRKPYY